MKITVFGASGRTGQQLVEQALAAGHQVTAVVRDPARLPISDPGLDVVTAGIGDPAALQSAIAGRDAVLSALAASAKAGDIATTAARNIHTAMQAGGVQRLVVVSAVPAGPEPEGEPLAGRLLLGPLIRFIFRDAYADLRRMEAEISSRPVDWTIVRPPRLLNTGRTETYRTTIGGSAPGGRQISRADLAHAMLAALDNPETVRQVVGVAD